jgi:prepilin-type N-terminal cleavage/methylation domain-containing protein
MTRRGFTLVEVLMAMVVLEVGFLGVAGTLLLAARTMRRAESLERAVTEAGRVYDSVSSLGDVGAGEAPVAVGRLRWRVDADRTLHVEVLTPTDSVLFSLAGRTATPVGR